MKLHARQSSMGRHSPSAFIRENMSASSFTTPNFFASSGDFLANSVRLLCISTSSSTFNRLSVTFGVRILPAASSAADDAMAGGGGRSSGNTLYGSDCVICGNVALLFDRISLISCNCRLARCCDVCGVLGCNASNTFAVSLLRWPIACDRLYIDCC